MTKVLMFGWEFPPYASGGLGTACYGLTKSLSRQGNDIIFVAPKADPESHKFLKIVPADMKKIKIRGINSPVTPYMTSEEYEKEYRLYSKSKEKTIYGRNLKEEVERFAKCAEKIAVDEDFDVIHCHDWLTFKAGINAKKKTGKPLVVHVHATEFDRGGGNGVNQYVYDIERLGMSKADKVIAVSNFTKNKIVDNYGISADKIEVVHNAVEFNDNKIERQKINENDKVVLFLGRITLQKGPEYFIDAAEKVLSKIKNVKFIVAGSGDMEFRMIERAAELGLGDKILFAGFLQGEDIDRAYKMADVYVMPSVSEPFGITPLESMRNGTPVIISKQSGVSEVIKHCLKVDFWDTDEIANKIIGVIKYKEVYDELKKNGGEEILGFSWDIPAEKCSNVYSEVKNG
ncbi:glycosyltransferase family 4 protein [Candidatus Woesearchaeota archaeon]|nr:glycosyltransferase family 4 protein [Candidatus Woesearchaeota archaeon]